MSTNQGHGAHVEIDSIRNVLAPTQTHARRSRPDHHPWDAPCAFRGLHCCIESTISVSRNLTFTGIGRPG